MQRGPLTIRLVLALVSFNTSLRSIGLYRSHGDESLQDQLQVGASLLPTSYLGFLAGFHEFTSDSCELFVLYIAVVSMKDGLHVAQSLIQSLV